MMDPASCSPSPGIQRVCQEKEGPVQRLPFSVTEQGRALEGQFTLLIHSSNTSGTLISALRFK